MKRFDIALLSMIILLVALSLTANVLASTREEAEERDPRPKQLKQRLEKTGWDIDKVRFID